MKFIGDSHGKELPQTTEIIYHVGDCNIGFGSIPKVIPFNYKFICGNHDNRFEAKKSYTNYLGHFGYIDELSMFFLSGGYSRDNKDRIEGYNWWPYEQLDYEEGYNALDLYEIVHPKIVLSHEAPFSVLPELFDFFPESTRTNILLDNMLWINKPKLWVFGHYHISVDRVINGTRFVCLNELEMKDLNL